MPVLAAGAHLDPEAGACVMEYASLLAGERFSDHPRAVHPLLAAVARVAKDLVADDERPRLLPLVPDCLGTARVGYPADPVLVGIVATVAQELNPASRDAPAALSSAKRRLRRRQVGGWARRAALAASARHYRRRAEWVLCRLLVEDVAPAGSPRVVDVLEAVVAECRRRTGDVRSLPRSAAPG